jgi:ribonuclease HI
MITYFTDGSCEPNPGNGGYAVIRLQKDGVTMTPAVLGGEANSTNIRMEGMALIAALQDAAGRECEIFSDSEFWIKVITIWSLPWEKNGWKKKGGEIKNLDLVRQVCGLYRESNAKLTWVRGHNNHPGNETADEWANRARLQFIEENK